MCFLSQQIALLSIQLLMLEAYDIREGPDWEGRSICLISDILSLRWVWHREMTRLLTIQSQSQTVLVMFLFKLPQVLWVGLLMSVTNFLESSPLRCPYDIILMKLFCVLNQDQSRCLSYITLWITKCQHQGPLCEIPIQIFITSEFYDWRH